MLSVSFEAWGLRGPELLCSVSDVVLPSALTNRLSLHPDVPITFNGALATLNGNSYFAFAFGLQSFYGCISVYISLVVSQFLRNSICGRLFLCVFYVFGPLKWLNGTGLHCSSELDSHWAYIFGTFRAKSL